MRKKFIIILLIIIISVLIIVNNYSNTKVSKYADFYGVNGSFIENNKESIFPKEISEESTVKKFCARKFSFIDDSYLGYLVIQYDNDKFLEEKNRLLLIDSSIGYEGYYGIQSFKKELCAIDIGSYGLVYALSNDNLKEISYVQISFCNNFSDIFYKLIINSNDLPVGFDASLFNHTRIRALKGDPFYAEIDKESNVMFYKIDKTNKELIISSKNKQGFKKFSFAKIKTIYKENGTNIESISFEQSDETFKPYSLSNLFNNPYLKTINGFENLDTSNAKDFSYMFAECGCIDNDIMSRIDTSAGIEFNKMFCNCNKVEYVDLSSFDFTNALSLANMYEGCTNLKKVDLVNCKIDRVNNITEIFKNCSKLEEVDLSKVDLSNCKFMDGAFSNCKSLTSINFEDAIISNVVSMDGIFESCESIEYIDLSNFDLSNLEDRKEFYKHLESYDPNDYRGYFVDCKNLKYVYFPKSFNYKTLDYERDFAGCDSLEAIYYKDHDTLKLIRSFK